MVVFRKKSRNTPVKTLENDTVYGERPWKWYSVHDSSLLGQLARCQTNQQNLLCLATSQLITHIPHLQKNLNEWFQLHLWIETNFTLAATGNPCESYNGIFSLNFWKKKADKTMKQGNCERNWRGKKVYFTWIIIILKHDVCYHFSWNPFSLHLKPSHPYNISRKTTPCVLDHYLWNLNQSALSNGRLKIISKWKSASFHQPQCSRIPLD